MATDRNVTTATIMLDLPILNSPTPKPILDPFTVQVQPREEPKTIEYTVVDNDNLSKIAEKYNTTWQRLWAKNPNLTNQDVLKVGDKIFIPAPDEVLADRPLYTLPVQENKPEPIKISSGGNLYEAGSCTWYVKNRRSDIPNNWGNASSWLGNAQAQGWRTGTTPVAGAIGWTSGHVVYVESVSRSTVVISEMNYDWTAYHQRTIEMPASKYIYIY